ncbi:MAG: hypothetical protein IJ335_03865 [Lachnospiraceae bacterium]|nr:hypothetical protein [Lachnospiraceae bacterium]
MLREILLYVIASGIGTFICKILERMPMNVWLARGIGCAVAVMTALLLYKFWLRKSHNKIRK